MKSLSIDFRVDAKGYVHRPIEPDWTLKGFDCWLTMAIYKAVVCMECRCLYRIPVFTTIADAMEDAFPAIAMQTNRLSYRDVESV